MSVNENIQLVKGGTGISETNELDVQDKDLGNADDAAETDPTEDATAIALLKGLLTLITTLNTNIEILSASIDTLNTNIGAKADTAVSTEDTSGSLIALTKGLITLNQPAG